MTDEESIAVVRKLVHRTDRTQRCKCDECNAIRRVCVLATEAVAMKAKKGREIERDLRIAKLVQEADQ